ncbi:hypothetical protein QFZ51_003603 [Chitinophaga sp. W3I9]
MITKIRNCVEGSERILSFSLITLIILITLILLFRFYKDLK